MDSPELKSKLRSTDHLIKLIINRNADAPNFAIFLGAGASASSGVTTAGSMIEEWRAELFKRSKSEKTLEEWLKQQEWYQDDREYSILFETLYDQPAQRRNYVEECVRNARPSWGYAYLTNLLAKRIFDVVFTTNFDDLINEACYLYSEDLRPIVAAHDSAVSGIRVTSRRPKIIKLHGDFLYDDIKNTVSELETLESNMKRKLTQFCQEYGLIVIGYGGADDSVMDTLEVLLRSNDYLCHGLYWCVRKGDKLSKRLRSLMRHNRIYLVPIDGFDEVMAETHAAADCVLPDSLKKPFKVARERVRLFVNPASEALKKHPVISKDIQDVMAELGSQSSVAKQDMLPALLKAALALRQNKTEEGIVQLRIAIKEDPDDKQLAYKMAEVLADSNKNEELLEYLKTAPIDTENRIYFLLRAGADEEVLSASEQLLSENPYEPFTRINRAISLKRCNRRDEMESELRFLEANLTPESPMSGAFEAGIAALRRDKEKMLRAIKKALGTELTKKSVAKFPVFEDYRDDPDLKALLDKTSEVD